MRSMQLAKGRTDKRLRGSCKQRWGGLTGIEIKPDVRIFILFRAVVMRSPSSSDIAVITLAKRSQ